MTELLFIPFYGAITGWLAVYLPITYLRYSKRREAMIKELVDSVLEEVDIEGIVENKLGNDVFDAEVEELIDNKLDDLVLVFKKQIPMASTFLVGNLVEKLKASAKSEIVKMIPGIKAKLVTRLKSELDPETLFEDIAHPIKGSVFERYFLRLCSAGATVGLLLGFVQLAMMQLLG